MHTFLATLRLFLRTENYLLCKGRGDSSLRCPAVMVPPTCQPIFTVLVQFLDRNRKPHLNQMQHVPVDHSPGDTLHQFAVWNRIEGHPDTLPTISTSRNG